MKKIIQFILSLSLCFAMIPTHNISAKENELDIDLVAKTLYSF